MAEGLLGMQPQMINICAQVSIPLILIIFDKLEASRYQGQKWHLNYVGTSLPSHPLPIARIIKRKNKIFTRGDEALPLILITPTCIGLSKISYGWSTNFILTRKNVKIIRLDIVMSVRISILLLVCENMKAPIFES
jgi:hypothetical protein